MVPHYEYPYSPYYPLPKYGFNYQFHIRKDIMPFDIFRCNLCTPEVQGFGEKHRVGDEIAALEMEGEGGANFYRP